MRFLSFVLVFAALSTSTVTAQDASACPNPTPYQAVPMQLNGANVGTAIDALRNDGMINPTNSTAGWCTSTDINACPNPLGFQKGSFPPDNSPPFCFGLTGIKNRMIEIMIETIAAGDRICVTDTGANTIETQNAPLVNLCGNGQVRACFAASSLRDTLPLSISCADGNSCSTSDTNFWYRVRVSNVDWVTAGDNVGTNSANMQPDMWCEMIKGNEMSRFPSQLAVVNERPVAQATMAPRSDASTTTSSLLISLAASIAAYVGMRA